MLALLLFSYVVLLSLQTVCWIVLFFSCDLLWSWLLWYTAYSDVVSNTSIHFKHKNHQFLSITILGHRTRAFGDRIEPLYISEYSFKQKLQRSKVVGGDYVEWFGAVTIEGLVCTGDSGFPDGVFNHSTQLGQMLKLVPTFQKYSNTHLWGWIKTWISSSSLPLFDSSRHNLHKLMVSLVVASALAIIVYFLKCKTVKRFK